jgi:hypothetical protein
MPFDLGDLGLQEMAEATVALRGFGTKDLKKALLDRAIMDPDRA